jgi:replication-associated recombination protein RarA
MDTSTRLPLTEKYRPKSLAQLVLPPQHNLAAALRFVRAPYPASFLLSGRSGLGKSSLAEIMAAAASHPLSIQHFVGCDLDSFTVKSLEATCTSRPLFGDRYSFVIDEADAIPAGGQIRLLRLLEIARYCCFIFTSNEGTDQFEARFLSRLIVQTFSNQGLAEPAARWLSQVARAEGLEMSINEGEKIMRTSRNNLRAALQALEILLAENEIPDARRNFIPPLSLSLGQDSMANQLC